MITFKIFFSRLRSYEVTKLRSYEVTKLRSYNVAVWIFHRNRNVAEKNQGT